MFGLVHGAGFASYLKSVSDADAMLYVSWTFRVTDASGRAVPLAWCGSRRAGDVLWLCVRASILLCSVAPQQSSARDTEEPRHMPHVAVLVQRGESLGPDTLLATIARIWVECGIRVSVIDDPAIPIAADAIVLHVSLTQVPEEYLRALERHPIVINGRVADISKRRVSRSLVTRGDGYTGPVIVKTNRNFRGVIESVEAERGDGRRRVVDALRNRLPWSFRSRLDEYPVLASPSDVPLGVWYNRDLVVERFLAERREARYCLRTWLFLGDQERMAIFYSNDAVVKSHNIIGRDRLEEVPDDLRAMRRELGFDFGKFDFAIVDGRTVLYDANRTPSLGAISMEEALPWLRQLASGLWSYLPKSFMS